MSQVGRPSHAFDPCTADLIWIENSSLGVPSSPPPPTKPSAESKTKHPRQLQTHTHSPPTTHCCTRISHPAAAATHTTPEETIS